MREIKITKDTFKDFDLQVNVDINNIEKVEECETCKDFWDKPSDMICSDCEK